MHYSGARFMPSAITALAGVIDLHHDLLVDALCRLAECQIHDVLQKRKKFSVLSSQFQANSFHIM